MELKIDINNPKIIKKVTNNKFGLFISHEWKRLIDPYTPRDTGTLMNDVSEDAFSIHYNTKYASNVYYGENMNFQKKNPYATYEWDVKASKAGQLNKLYRSANNYLNNK